LILQNKQGRTRLSKWFFATDDEEKLKVEKEVYRTIILRDVKQTNILEVIFYKLFKNV
jgi:AP-2 complex subunit sigma-1